MKPGDQFERVSAGFVTLGRPEGNNISKDGVITAMVYGERNAWHLLCLLSQLRAISGNKRHPFKMVIELYSHSLGFLPDYFSLDITYVKSAVVAIDAELDGAGSGYLGSFLYLYAVQAPPGLTLGEHCVNLGNSIYLYVSW